MPHHTGVPHPPPPRLRLPRLRAARCSFSLRSLGNHSRGSSSSRFSGKAAFSCSRAGAGGSRREARQWGMGFASPWCVSTSHRLGPHGIGRRGGSFEPLRFPKPPYELTSHVNSFDPREVSSLSGSEELESDGDAERELERVLTDVPLGELQRARRWVSCCAGYFCSRPAEEGSQGEQRKRPVEISTNVQPPRFREVIQVPKKASNGSHGDGGREDGGGG